MKKRIYLDHAAATPVYPQVTEAMLPYLSERFGNPSSLHQEGKQAKQALENARDILAKTLNAQREEIVFTSSGTESCNLAIFGTVSKSKGHVITTMAEHHAVLEPLQELQKRGYEVTFLPVDEDGMVSPKEVAAAVKDTTVLVSVMMANNEVGSMNPIKEIVKAVKKKNSMTLVHTDACQAFGYQRLDVKSLGVDLLTVNASKIYGPKGAGALFVKEGTPLTPTLSGGGQERERRSGTENIPAIVGFAQAATLLPEQFDAAERITELRDYLIAQILEKIDGAVLNGHPTNRLPNNVNVSIPGVEGETLVIFLDQKGIACSTAAACTTASTEPSHVLLAMGRSEEEALSTLRFSLGISTTKEEVDFVVEKLLESVTILRK